MSYRLDTTTPKDGTELLMDLDELVTPSVDLPVVVRSFGRLRLGRIVELKRSRVVVEVPQNRHGAMVTRAYPRDDVYVPSLPRTIDEPAEPAAEPRSGPAEVRARPTTGPATVAGSAIPQDQKRTSAP